VFPIFWPVGWISVLSNLADTYLYTRFESNKAVYQIIKKGNTGNLTSKQFKQYGNLHYTLAEETLMQELSMTTQRAPIRPNIVISHADNDKVIPPHHGRSLLDTISTALDKNDDEPHTIRRYSWGQALSIQDDLDDAVSYTLIQSRKGGHNGVPSHTIQLFGQIVGLQSSVQ
jgi:hypothetical protein